MYPDLKSKQSDLGLIIQLLDTYKYGLKNSSEVLIALFISFSLMENLLKSTPRLTPESQMR